MNIICEGVETENQIKFLQNNGCFVIQGYFYDKPLPQQEFESRLINKKYNKER